MKKKIFNWIYSICRKILATDKSKPYWLIETRIPKRLRMEASICEQHLPYGIDAKISMENDVKHKLLKELYDQLVVVNRKAEWDAHTTIYSVEILIVDVNGTNK